MPQFLDLVHHWMFEAYDLDEKKRITINRQLIGVLITHDEVETSNRPKWAPAWWDSDEDATMSNMAAMQALTRR